MSEFLRLDFVRDEVGIALAVGDKILLADGYSMKIHSQRHASHWASASSGDNQRYIKSFAPRKNEGVQPVGSDIVVDVVWDDAVRECDRASMFSWDGLFHASIETYTPSYDALLKMQNEFDEKESEVITEKEMKIVEAVNYCKAMIEVNDGELAIGYAPSGDLASHFTYGHGYYDDICTVAEFNQCIEEMAAAKWLHKGVGYHDYASHIAWCRLKCIDTSNKRLQKEDEKPVYTKAMKDAGEMPSVGMRCMFQLVHWSSLDWKEVIIKFVGDKYLITEMPNGEEYCVDHASCEPSRKPKFKSIETRTPEEIEAEKLEAAKKEQREIVAVVLSCEHNKKFNDHEPTVPSDFLDEAGSLQDLGLLDKIILPLKG